MALVLNGSANTIGGLAVGGLPDGIVDTDMLAAAAVTDIKRGPGTILQQVQTTATGNVSSSSASDIVASGHICSVTPKQTGSKFLVEANNISGHFNETSTTNPGALYYIYVSVNSGSYANVTTSNVANVHTNGDIGQWINVPISFSFLASPSYSAGQTVAFQTYFRRGGGDSTNVTFYYAHGGHADMNNQVRTLTVTELAQ
jgi:hypothetical protein